MVNELAHDLRSSSMAIGVAADLLLDPLSPYDEQLFQQVLSRNLVQAQAMLTGLPSLSWLEAEAHTSPLKRAIMDLSALLSQIQADLMGVIPTTIQQQLNQLVELANSLVS